MRFHGAHEYRSYAATCVHDCTSEHAVPGKPQPAKGIFRLRHEPSCFSGAVLRQRFDISAEVHFHRTPYRVGFFEKCGRQHPFHMILCQGGVATVPALKKKEIAVFEWEDQTLICSKILNILIWDCSFNWILKELLILGCGLLSDFFRKRGNVIRNANIFRRRN